MVNGLIFTPVKTQTVAVSTGSARCSVDLTYPILEVWCTVTCFVKLGSSSVTAVDTDYAIPANTIVRIPRGDNARIAAIAGGSGSLYVTELN